jgi:hypothetical protein
MNTDDVTYSVVEDEEVIAKFKRLEDASSFAANRGWQKTRCVVSLVIERATTFRRNKASSDIPVSRFS